jgi:hypothetical protein
MSIEDYNLLSRELYSILKRKGIEYLFHANTVATSMTFIENRALLSRQYVESNGLVQTDQRSDEKDKNYDVYDHIFLDALDLHKKYKQANVYGPVLFRMKLDLLTSPSIKNVIITKSNPWYWKDSTKESDKFYSSIDEVASDYLSGKKLDSQIMFTFRGLGDEMKLNKFLDSIIIDKPIIHRKLKSGQTLGGYVEATINNSLRQHGLGHIPIHTRECPFFCRCHLDYLKLSKEEIIKRFGGK